jgi:hypothetical protein
MTADATDLQLRLIVEMTDFLAEHDIDHWLFGGWGVDFLLGAVTRSHSDVDMIVWRWDLTTVRRLFVAFGYRVLESCLPDEGAVFAKHNQRIDIGIIEPNGRGSIVSPGRRSAWPWPLQSFSARYGRLGEIVSPLVSAQGQYDMKLNYGRYVGWEAGGASLSRAEQQMSIHGSHLRQKDLEDLGLLHRIISADAVSGIYDCASFERDVHRHAGQDVQRHARWE